MSDEEPPVSPEPVPAAAVGEVIDDASVRSWVDRTLCLLTRSMMSWACAMPPVTARSSAPPATSGYARARPLT